MRPLRVFRKRKAAGKCFTRIFRRPLKRVTVCSGTNCLKATKKADWAATPPQMVANLFVDYWLVRVVILDNGRGRGKTYDRSIFLVSANQTIYRRKAVTFGTTATTNRNFPNSLDPHALSKYFPP